MKRPVRRMSEHVSVGAVVADVRELHVWPDLRDRHVEVSFGETIVIEEAGGEADKVYEVAVSECEQCSCGNAGGHMVMDETYFFRDRAAKGEGSRTSALSGIINRRNVNSCPCESVVHSSLKILL